MDLSNLHYAEGSKQSETSGEVVDTVQETVRQPARDIRARRLVPERRDRASRAARCRYTEDFRREASPTEIPR